MLISGIFHLARTALGWPNELFLCPLVVVLVVAEGALNDLKIKDNCGWIICLEKLFCIFAYIEHRGLLRGLVKQVSNVFKTNKNLVSLLWK